MVDPSSMERGCASYSFTFSLEFYRFVLFGVGETKHPSVIGSRYCQLDVRAFESGW
jgi:hypothetical protein